MILKIFSVYDSAAGAYLQPFFFASAGQAIRAFSDMANDPASSLHRHAADYTLFELGSWDDENAMLLIEKHINLGKALEFKAPELPHIEVVK